ncbi:MAG: SurA N-terminal domain-containing protein [Clostridiales bacterium]|nr:SurA N-terminal domain-containing protein [Clostridiales bacterium]MCF8022955.1 SurA N-terminal domain-containing protein [Clostridiales bacterium]
MRKIILLVCTGLLILAMAGCGEEANENKVNNSVEKVAVVNGQILYRDELESQMEQVKSQYKQQGKDLDSEENEAALAELEKQVLEEMIDKTVLLQEADKEGISIKNEEVKSQFDQMEAQFGGEEQFNKVLKNNDITVEKLKQDMSEQLKIEKYIENAVPEEEISVSEKETRNYYDQVKEQSSKEIGNYENLKSQIENMLKQQKVQSVQDELLESLKEDMVIERYL